MILGVPGKKLFFQNDFFCGHSEKRLGFGAQVKVLGPAFGIKPGLDDRSRRGGGNGLKPRLGPFPFPHLPGQPAVPEENNGQDQSDDGGTGNAHLQQKVPVGPFRKTHIDPVIGDLFPLRFRDGSKGLIQNRSQLGPVFPHRKPKTGAVPGCYRDLEVLQTQLPNGIDGGSGSVHISSCFSAIHRLQPLFNIVHQKQSDFRKMLLHHFLFIIALHHGHPFTFQITHSGNKGRIPAGNGDNGKIEIRSGKIQNFTSLGCPGDAGEHIQLSSDCGLFHLQQTEALDRGHVYTQLLIQDIHVAG